MSALTEESIRKLFLEARTHGAWLDRPVDEATLRRVYELARMGPTAANAQPMRVLFVTTPEAKERLRPCLSPGNVDRTMSAPATAIVAYDTDFHEQMPKLFPARPEMKASMAALPEPAREALLAQNTALQASFLIVAARSLGLDCGPMGGFDKAKVDAEILGGLRWKSTLLVNLGYGDPSKLHPRLPRLSFDEGCRIG